MSFAFICLALSAIVGGRFLFPDRSMSFVLTVSIAIFLSLIGISTFVLRELSSLSLMIGLGAWFVTIAIYLTVCRVRVRDLGSRLLGKTFFGSGDICFFASLAFTISLTALVVRLNPTPPGNSLDAAAHFSMVRYLLEHHVPPGGDWQFLWEIAFYPYGFHVNAALLSERLGVPPTFVLWALPALLVSIGIAACSTMIWESLSTTDLSKKTKRYACVVAVLLLSVNSYGLETFIGAGFYPMTTAMFIALVLLWMTFPRFEMNAATVLVFAVCLSFVPVTYPQWGPYLCLYFAVLVYKSRFSRAQKAISILAVAMPAASIGLVFLLQNLKGLTYIFQVEGWSKRDPILIVGLLILTGLGLLYSKVLRRSNLTLLFVCCLAEAVGLVAAKSSSGVGAFYHLYKFAYILAPIAIVMTLCSAAFVMAPLRLRRVSQLVILICLIHALAHFKFSTDHHITVDDIAAFDWISHNDIAKPSIGFALSQPEVSSFALWGYALSGKPASVALTEWWAKPCETFQAWFDRASFEDIAVTRIDRAAAASNRAIRVLYSSGQTAVVQKVAP